MAALQRPDMDEVFVADCRAAGAQFGDDVLDLPVYQAMKCSRS